MTKQNKHAANIFLAQEAKLTDASVIVDLKRHVGFFSIGTNDLTQCTMAAGRKKPMVSEYFIDDHPAILRLIELVVKEAGDTPVSLCGELSGRIGIIVKILKTGIRSLSVSAFLVPEVKNAVINTALSDV